MLQERGEALMMSFPIEMPHSEKESREFMPHVALTSGCYATSASQCFIVALSW
jgi:hypothetical protein